VASTPPSRMWAGADAAFGASTRSGAASPRRHVLALG
jgi:hypothetical protein